MTEPSVLPTQPTTRQCPFDPPAEYREIRERTPVARMRLPEGATGVVVTGSAEVRTVFTDPRFGASSRPIQRDASQPAPTGTLTEGRALPGMFVTMDAPEHTRYRRLLAGRFTVRRMRALVPRIQEIVTEHLDAMAAAGGPLDLVTDYAMPIPSLVICELLGVPYADRAEFHRNSMLATDTDVDRATGQQARGELARYIHSLVRAKHERPTTDLLGELVTEGELSDAELTGIGVLLLIAGHETTANMIALATMALLAHPEQLALLRGHPDILDGAVEELLRHLTIVQFGMRRIAHEDVELGGTRIRAGETVVAMMSPANRDPAQFPGDPDVLALDREPRPHLAFGHGPHGCLGQQLARAELKVALPALFERFPDLRLHRPLADIPMRTTSSTYGPRELLVTW